MYCVFPAGSRLLWMWPFSDADAFWRSLFGLFPSLGPELPAKMKLELSIRVHNTMASAWVRFPSCLTGQRREGIGLSSFSVLRAFHAFL